MANTPQPLVVVDPKKLLISHADYLGKPPAEARRKIKKLMEDYQIAITPELVSKARAEAPLKVIDKELPSRIAGVAIWEGTTWVRAYYDGTANTGVIKANKPVVFDTVKGWGVTGIHESWGQDEYTIVGTAIKDYNNINVIVDVIPVRLNQAMTTSPTGFRAVEFTLTSGVNSSTKTAGATVTTSMDSATVKGANITVHDDQLRWPDAITTCKGTAIRADFTDAAETQPYWHILSCQRAVRLAKAFLTAALAYDANPTITNWTPIPVGEHVIDPGVPTLLGTLINAGSSGGAAHACPNGGQVWMFRTNNAPPFIWQVYEVSKQRASILATDPTIGDYAAFRVNSLQFQGYYRSVMVECSTDVGSWQRIFDITENCPF